MKDLLRDSRVWRLMIANTTSSIGSGVTIFAVPWLLVQRAGGSEAYRWATVGTTIVLFLVMPHYGAWVDSHSRKSLLLLSEAFGACATLSMAAIGLALGGFATWQLVAVYFCGMFYYTLHYPAKFAFIQQIFNPSQYQSLTGLMEIQGQTAMLVAGGLGGVLVEHVPLWVILLIDASTYAVSFALQATLPYHPDHLTPPAAATVPGLPGKPGVWHSALEGWQWLRERPQLAIYLTCSLLPFIAVMAGNYLFPIYVSQTLRADAYFFAGGEVAFAVGAIVAGAMLPRLLRHRSSVDAIPLTMLVFLAGLAGLVVFRVPWFYLVASVFLGFGNAGCRVARNTLTLTVIPNRIMGRIGIFYSVFDRLLRTLLVSAMVIVDYLGTPAGFLILAAMVALGLSGVWRSRSAVGAELAAPA